MNWEAVGAIAELAGAIGVVVTLVYLALQIRQSSELVEQNNRLLNVSMANSIRDAQNEVSRILASNPSSASAWWKGLPDRASLTDEERYVFDSLAYLTFSASQQGLSSDSEETLKTLRWSLQHPGILEWWDEYKDIYNQPMRDAVHELRSRKDS